jgi:hypothetical protein
MHNGNGDIWRRDDEVALGDKVFHLDLNCGGRRGVRNDVHQQISDHCHTPSSSVGETERTEGSAEVSQPTTGVRECPILRGLCEAVASG